MKKNIHQCLATGVKRLFDSSACTHQTAIRGHPCHQENQALPRLILPSLARHPWGCTLVTKMGSSPLLLPLPPATVIPRDSCGSFFTVMCFSWQVTHWDRSYLTRINNIVKTLKEKKKQPKKPRTKHKQVVVEGVEDLRSLTESLSKILGKTVILV